MRVLLIEDNPTMAAALKRGLQDHGHSTDVCHNGVEGEDLATVEPYDIILLDIMMPDRNGIAVCRNMRRRKVRTPILAISAMNTDEDRNDMLEAGADKFLCKPFEFAELLQEIGELTNRNERTGAGVIAIDGMTLDLRTRQVIRNGKRCDLSKRQCELLEYMMSRPHRTLSRREIIENVWNIREQSSSNVVDSYIAALRKKLDPCVEHQVIETVRGVGYRFIGGRRDEKRRA